MIAIMIQPPPGDEWGESVQSGSRTSTFIEAHVFVKNEETTELILIDLNKARTRHSPRDAQRTARRYADGVRARRSTRQTPADLQSRDLVFVRRTDRSIRVTVGVDLPLPDGPAMRSCDRTGCPHLRAIHALADRHQVALDVSFHTQKIVSSSASSSPSSHTTSSAGVR